MTEQVPERDRLAVRNGPGQPVVDRIVERELPLADELENDGGDERLRDAPDPEAIRHPHRRLSSEIRVAAREPQRSVLAVDEHDDSRYAGCDELVHLRLQRRALVLRVTRRGAGTCSQEKHPNDHHNQATHQQRQPEGPAHPRIFPRRVTRCQPEDRKRERLSGSRAEHQPRRQAPHGKNGTGQRSFPARQGSVIPGRATQEEAQLMQNDERHPVLEASDRFPTETVGLPGSVQPEIVELAAGELFELEIAPVVKQLGDATVRMLAYNGSIPGPTLKVQQGSEVVVDVANDGRSRGDRALARAAGREPLRRHARDAGADGRSARRFTYRLQFPDPGVYWYHPHIREDYGQELGLYGNILVVPTDPDYWAPVNRELLLTLDDVLLEDGQIAPFSRSRDDARGDGPLRQHDAGRRRAGPRADGRARRGRALLPDQHREHPRLQRRPAGRADEARRRRQRPLRAGGVRRRGAARTVGARGRRRPLRQAGARHARAPPLRTAATRSRRSRSTRKPAAPSLAEQFEVMRTQRGHGRRAGAASLPTWRQHRTRRSPSSPRWTWASPRAPVVYACPMHPEVVSAERGQLPEVRDEAARDGRAGDLRLPDAPGGRQRRSRDAARSAG